METWESDSLIVCIQPDFISIWEKLLDIKWRNGTRWRKGRATTKWTGLLQTSWRFASCLHRSPITV